MSAQTSSAVSMTALWLHTAYASLVIHWLRRPSANAPKAIHRPQVTTLPAAKNEVAPIAVRKIMSGMLTLTCMVPSYNGSERLREPEPHREARHLLFVGDAL